MFFEGILKDKERDISMEMEFGRSSFYDGENLIYLNVNGKGVVLNEEEGRKLFQSMMELGSYLGYDR
jgi:hypothetical protein